jgi:hypothetical protein
LWQQLNKKSPALGHMSKDRASSVIGTDQAIATQCGDTTMTGGQSPMKAIRHQEVMTQKRLRFSNRKQASQ